MRALSRGDTAPCVRHVTLPSWGMADEALRELERNAASGGSEAEDRLFCENIRLGRLSEERVRLAAWLG